MKKIIHIDLNTFFIQVETILDSSLKNIPAAVGYNSRRGVLCTSNYEARKYGVNSGDSIAVALKKCPKLKIINPHYHLYKKYSDNFLKLLKSKTNLIEIASIDEAYLDLSDYLSDENIEEQLFDLQTEIYRKTNLKCSIGCSYTKFFAKMASDLVKPLGLTIITKDNYKDLLFNLDINKIYGLGKKTCELLYDYNIKTINDLINTKDKNVLELLGSRYSLLINELNGNSSSYISNTVADRKSISAERTFSSDEEEYDSIIKMIELCTHELIDLITKEKIKVQGLTIKLRYSNFKTISRKVSLDNPSDNFTIIYQHLLNLYDSLEIDNPIRLIGVKFDNLFYKDNIEIISDNDQMPLNIF